MAITTKQQRQQFGRDVPSPRAAVIALEAPDAKALPGGDAVAHSQFTSDMNRAMETRHVRDAHAHIAWEYHFRRRCLALLKTQESNSPCEYERCDRLDISIRWMKQVRGKSPRFLEFFHPQSEIAS